MTTKSSIILGLIGAAAAGVLVGLLLAPEKGTELRNKIRETAGDWTDHVTDMFSNAKSDLENLRNKGAKEARNMANEAGNKFNNVKESYS
ncbi:MAG: YtxH domain-containing protein [Chitinophagaceae bacterium]